MLSSAKDIGSGTVVAFNLRSFLAGGGGENTTEVSSAIAAGDLLYTYSKPSG